LTWLDIWPKKLSTKHDSSCHERIYFVRKLEPEVCNASCPPLGCPRGSCPGMCCSRGICDPCCVSKMPRDPPQLRSPPLRCCMPYCPKDYSRGAPCSSPCGASSMDINRASLIARNDARSNLASQNRDQLEFQQVPSPAQCNLISIPSSCCAIRPVICWNI